MTTSPAAVYNRLHAIDRTGMSAEARAEIESIMFCVVHDLRQRRQDYRSQRRANDRRHAQGQRQAQQPRSP